MPATKQPRRLRLTSPIVTLPDGRIRLSVLLTMPDGEIAEYAVCREGERVTFTKLTSSKRRSPSGDDTDGTRTVDLDMNCCDCPGYRRWRTECRHRGMARKLIELGHL